MPDRNKVCGQAALVVKLSSGSANDSGSGSVTASLISESLYVHGAEDCTALFRRLCGAAGAEEGGAEETLPLAAQRYTGAEEPGGNGAHSKRAIPGNGHGICIPCCRVLGAYTGMHSAKLAMSMCFCKMIGEEARGDEERGGVATPIGTLARNASDNARRVTGRQARSELHSLLIVCCMGPRQPSLFARSCSRCG